MLVKVGSVGFLGIETIDVRVEVNVASRGFPVFDIVGLPAKSVAESKQRVRTAIVNSGFNFPARRITVNLAPADFPKDGTFYDLPIAVGILAATGVVKIPPDSLFFGELSLDGGVNPARGTFLAVLHAEKFNYKSVFIPEKSVGEILARVGPRVFPTDSLENLVRHLNSEFSLTPFNFRKSDTTEVNFPVKMEDIISQQTAKRALEIAAVGGHNILLLGPPGAGKTMLANAFMSILPPLTPGELTETAKIYSAAGTLAQNKQLLSGLRPFRAPHHSASFAGFIGSGNGNRSVGELSLAHNGVLFMDEFPEFSRPIIESLRQPLEDGIIRISRRGHNSDLPARFMLVAAMNPCPCGFNGSGIKECVCFPSQIRAYRAKISGPILDRIDLCVQVPAVKNSDLIRNSKGSLGENSTSHEILQRVLSAQKFKSQFERQKIEKFSLNDESIKFLRGAISKLNLSARSYFKVLRVAETIACLDRQDSVLPKHIAEALQYRPVF